MVAFDYLKEQLTRSINTNGTTVVSKNAFIFHSILYVGSE